MVLVGPHTNSATRVSPPRQSAALGSCGPDGPETLDLRCCNGGTNDQQVGDDPLIDVQVAYRDPKTTWVVKALCAFAVAYALRPRNQDRGC